MASRHDADSYVILVPFNLSMIWSYCPMSSRTISFLAFWLSVFKKAAEKLWNSYLPWWSPPPLTGGLWSRGLALSLLSARSGILFPRLTGGILFYPPRLFSKLDGMPRPPRKLYWFRFDWEMSDAFSSSLPKFSTRSLWMYLHSPLLKSWQLFPYLQSLWPWTGTGSLRWSGLILTAATA